MVHFGNTVNKLALTGRVKTFFAPYLLLFILLLSGFLAPQAQTDDFTKDLKQAITAYKKKSPSQLAKIAKRLPVDYPSLALINYWRAELELDQGKPKFAQAQSISNLSAYHRTLLVAKLFDYYAQVSDWEKYYAYQQDEPLHEAGVCASYLAAKHQDAIDSAVQIKLKEHWDNEFSNKQVCKIAYQHAFATGHLQEDDFWIKLRNFAFTRKYSKIRQLVNVIPNKITYRQVRSVIQRSRQYILSKHSLATRASKEMVIIAAIVAVRKHPNDAYRRWLAFSGYFSQADNHYVYARLAEWYARWHRKNALSIFKTVPFEYYSDSTFAWHVRAALWQQDWNAVLRVIKQMSAEQQQVTAWVYWRAKALIMLGQTEKAETMFKDLSKKDDYYGLLASAELDVYQQREVIAEYSDSAKQSMISYASATPEIAIATQLYKAGYSARAFSYWRQVAQIIAGRQENLLGAAYLFAEQGWYLGSIDAAHRAKRASHSLLYPRPAFMREMLGSYGDKYGLDLNFVYGLIRQESRFMPSAISSAGARGLMQVMPATAKSTARRHGFTRYQKSRLTRVDSNVIVGMTFLSDLSKQVYSNPVLAAAGYNAGPTRLKRWLPKHYEYLRKKIDLTDASLSDQRLIELLIEVENIPLTETRLYAKHLIANRQHYHARMLGEYANPLQFHLWHPIR